jgi:peptidoglycan/LPS O-acetylase OafA/YrhL
MSNDNRKEEEQYPTRNFFLRRLFRIVPMFYLAVALACVLHPVYAGSRTDVVLSLLFLHGFSSSAISHGAAGGWSIATESIFYMCLPLLFRVIRNLSDALAVFFVGVPILFVTSMSLAALHPETDYFSFFWFPVQFPIFMMGIVCYFIWKRYIASTGQHPELSFALLLLAGLLICLNFPSGNRNMYPFSVAGALLLLGLSLYPWPLLVNRFTVFLGRISYSVYLLHAYFMVGVAPHVRSFSLGPQFLLLFLGTLLLTIPISFLTWRWIETPGIQLGRWLIEYLEKPAMRSAENKLSLDA